MHDRNTNLHIKSVKKHNQVEFVTTDDKFKYWNWNTPIQTQSTEIRPQSLSSVYLKLQFIDKMDLVV